MSTVKVQGNSFQVKGLHIENNEGKFDLNISGNSKKVKVVVTSSLAPNGTMTIKREYKKGKFKKEKVKKDHISSKQAAKTMHIMANLIAKNFLSNPIIGFKY